MEVSKFYKKWVGYLKARKVYGRYLMYIQSANRKIDEEKKRDREYRENREHMWFVEFTWLSYLIENIGPYFSKEDHFQDRFYVNNIRELRYHINTMSFRFPREQSDFLFKTISDFQKLLELEKEKALPVPRSFRKRPSGHKFRGEREENSPWYNKYYQNKKQVWKR